MAEEYDLELAVIRSYLGEPDNKRGTCLGFYGPPTTWALNFYWSERPKRAINGFTNIIGYLRKHHGQ